MAWAALDMKNATIEKNEPNQSVRNGPLSRAVNVR
jgi:hypothetical protein